MRLVGLLTEDSRRYYEMIEALKAEDIEYTSLDFCEPVPSDVSVVVTTERERDRVVFDRVVVDDDPAEAVASIRRFMNGGRPAKDLVIGVDPGHRPGVAALADGIVLTRTVAKSPEDVKIVVDGILREYPSSNVVIRIGNGDRTNRNRTFNDLWDRGHRLEIVDERNTTTRSATPDEDAAVEIALTPGFRPDGKQKVDPAPGEIRNIQRLSRLQSEGTLTVSKDLASKVAKGEISMDQAISLQRESACGDVRTGARP